MKIHKIESTSFGRKPNAREMLVYTQSVEAGLKLLDKEVDVIIHNASMPSLPGENPGIGSMFSRATLKKLVPFLKQHAIKGIQIEPTSIRGGRDVSPYAPESSAQNIYMIPLEKLASDEYNNLLSKQTFNNIAEKSPKGDRVDYGYVSEKYDVALREAYENFKKGDFLKQEFEEFKSQKSDYLEKAAIFRILNNLYKKSWSQWKRADKMLFSPQTERQIKSVSARLGELRTQFADEINYFMFNQFILDKEHAKFNEETAKAGIRVIGDSPVASPSADEWINQNLYLKGKALGCPPDYFSKSGQRWGFRYFDPEKIFNSDGTLGEAGKILKQKYEDYFESFPGGLRIDHVIGLIDPFIYTTSEKMNSRNSGRIYSMFTGKYQKKPSEYSNIFEKIVFAAAEKLGIKKSSIICEDLGEPNAPTIQVMQEYDLPGIAVTQFGYRGADVPSKNVIMIGSHDNKSLLEYVDEVFENKSKDEKSASNFEKSVQTLSNDIAPKRATKKQKEKMAKKIGNDKSQYIAARFAELFTSPARRIQIFFTDMWGIPKTYNIPQTKKGNWSLRLGENFESDYYKAVSEGKAPNFALAIRTALRQRGLDKQNPQLMSDLESSAKILNEK